MPARDQWKHRIGTVVTVVPTATRTPSPQPPTRRGLRFHVAAATGHLHADAHTTTLRKPRRRRVTNGDHGSGGIADEHAGTNGDHSAPDRATGNRHGTAGRDCDWGCERIRRQLRDRSGGSEQSVPVAGSSPRPSPAPLGTAPQALANSTRRAHGGSIPSGGSPTRARPR